MHKGLFILFLFLMVFTPPLAGICSPPREVLIRQDRFFGGPFSIPGHPYLIRGQVVYTGQDVFQSAYLHYQVDEETVQSTFFEEIGLNPHIPFFYQAETPWLPENTGEYTLKVWFTGLNGAPEEEGFSDTLKHEVILYENLPSRQLALLESFSSINCGSCAIVAPLLLEIVEDHPEDYAMIYYHPLAYEGSPLFAFNPKDQTSRKEFYGVNYTPVAAIGSTFFGGSFEVNPELMALEKEKFAAFTMAGSYTIENDVLHASVSLEAFTDFPEYNANALLVAITENLVHFEAPPGSNGEKDFHHVMRSFLPDAIGTNLSGVSRGERRQYAFEYDLSTGVIDTSQVSVLAFIQDMEDMEIHQIIRLNFQASNNTSVILQQSLNGKLFPNPSRGSLELFLSLTGSSARVCIFDLNGRKVFEQSYPSGSPVLLLDLEHLPEGIYLLQAFSGKGIFHQKISIIR